MLEPGGRGCNEPRSCHCTLAWAREQDSVSKQKQKKKNKITSVGKDVEKREPMHSVGEKVSQHSHYGRQYSGSSIKLKTELPYRPQSL